MNRRIRKKTYKRMLLAKFKEQGVVMSSKELEIGDCKFSKDGSRAYINLDEPYMGRDRVDLHFATRVVHQ